MPTIYYRPELLASWVLACLYCERLPIYTAAPLHRGTAPALPTLPPPPYTTYGTHPHLDALCQSSMCVVAR